MALMQRADRIAAAEMFFVKVPPMGDDKHVGDPYAKYLCNIVFQGGGVLGLAHVGFLTGLEAAGVRAAGIAGASAGAIVATALACATRGRLGWAVSDKLLDVVASMPMSEFIDGPLPIRALIKRYLSGALPLQPEHWGALGMAFRRLTGRRGLNPGIRFEEWLEGKFTDLKVATNQVLRDHLRTVEVALRAFAEWSYDQDYLLRIIATAMPVGLKGIFPRDLNVLQPSYVQASPALFVRASMAIPGFFEPKFLEVDPPKWREDVLARLQYLTTDRQREDYSQTNTLAFVDGGLLSNVPVDAFEEMTLKASGEPFPTVVATLVRWTDSDAYNYKRNSLGLIKDTAKLINAVRLQRDRDAVSRLRGSFARRTKIVPIDTREHDWLNFTMLADEQGDLFMSGLNRARDFLAKL